MKLTNKSKKVIGIGTVTVLPDETVTLPKEFESNPVIKLYVNLGMAAVVNTEKKTAAGKSSNKGVLGDKINCEAENK